MTTRLAPCVTRPWRLKGPTRKGFLVVHIVSVVSAGAWIGIDVVMAVLIFTALLTDEGGIKALSYRALELFAVWPLFTSGLVCLLSGVVLGLGRRSGRVAGCLGSSSGGTYQPPLPYSPSPLASWS